MNRVTCSFLCDLVTETGLSADYNEGKKRR